MNKQVRHLGVVMALMVVTLMVALTSIQFFQASSLSADSRNKRSFYLERGRERGPIVVSGSPIVVSKKSDDAFKYLRSYRSPEMYSHVTGFYASALASSSGLEHYSNGVLSGTSGNLLKNRVATLFTGEQPSGGVVETTLNPEVQKAAFDSLGKQRGAAVALNPTTGEILALVSTPGYDPNLLTANNDKVARAAMGALEKDPAKPLVNRAIGGNLWAPGSTFKVVTTAAWLEADSSRGSQSPVSAPTKYQLPGSKSFVYNPGKAKCGNGSGEVPLSTAVAQSCNTPFAQMAVEVGAGAMEKQAEAFGFGHSLTIPLATTPSVFPHGTDPAQLAMSGFGQYEVKTNALQMAMVAAGIANGGKVMEPQLVARELTSNLEVLRTLEPRVFSTATSPNTAAILRDLMVGVVKQGTGRAAALPGVSVAGKTGTAETGSEANQHAWFIGFAPAEKPVIAVAVFVENGGSDGANATGGRTAAPIARAMLKARLNK